MLKINITKKFKKRSLFENFQYNFQKNNIYKLIGTNGSGKSTICSLIYKLDEKYTGEITYNGENIKEITKEHLRTNLISYVSQKPALLSNKSLLKNLNILVQDYDKDKFNEYIQKFKMEDLVNKKLKKLSGGEKQKCELIVGLLKEYEILILDEVDRNLDDESTKNLEEIINTNEKKAIVLVISHFDLNCNYTDIVDIEKNNEKETIEKDGIEKDIENKVGKSKILKKNPAFRYILWNNKIIKIFLSIILSLIILYQLTAIIRVEIQYSQGVIPYKEKQNSFEESTMVVYAPFFNQTLPINFKNGILKDNQNLYFDSSDYQELEKETDIEDVKIVPVAGKNNSALDNGLEWNDQVAEKITIPKNYFTNKEIQNNEDIILEPSNFTIAYSLYSKSMLEDTGGTLQTEPIIGTYPKDNSKEIVIPLEYAQYYAYKNKINDLNKLINKEISVPMINSDTKEEKSEKFTISGISEEVGSIYIAYNENSKTNQRLIIENNPFLEIQESEVLKNRAYETAYTNYSEELAIYNSSNPTTKIKAVSEEVFQKNNPDLIEAFYIKCISKEAEEKMYDKILKAYPQAQIVSNTTFERGASKTYYSAYIKNTIKQLIIIFTIALALISLLFSKYLISKKEKNDIFKFHGYSSGTIKTVNLIDNILIVGISLVPNLGMIYIIGHLEFTPILLIIGIVYVATLFLIVAIVELINKRYKKIRSRM